MSSRFDVNKDGSLSQAEIRDAREVIILELQEEKADDQRRFGWTAMLSMIGFTVALCTPLIDVERVKALSGAIDNFYLAMAAVVGAVVGVTTWMTNSRMQTYSSGYQSYYEEDADHESSSGYRLGKYGSTS